MEREPETAGHIALLDFVPQQQRSFLPSAEDRAASFAP
jgi:hypothetical protein